MFKKLIIMTLTCKLITYNIMFHFETKTFLILVLLKLLQKVTIIVLEKIYLNFSFK